MGTPLKKVYDSFLGKVTDYNFIKLNKEDKLEPVLRSYLESATVRFTNCTKDLTIDELNNSFNEDLDLFEVEILSIYMLFIYVSGKILNVKNMEQNLSEREFRKYSEANHLKAMQGVRTDLQSEASQLQSSYSLRQGLEDFD